MIFRKKYIKLFTSCFLVKGVKRATICDTQRNSIYTIPLSFYEVLTQYEDMPIVDIFKVFLNDRDVLEEYFNFLIVNELGFWCDDISRFPKICLDWNTPEFINNTIIEIEGLSNIHLRKIMTSLKLLKCKYLEIRAYKSCPIDKIQQLLELCKNSQIRGIVAYIKYCNNIKLESLKAIAKTNGRLIKIILHSAPKSLKNSKDDITFTPEKVSSGSHCGNINKNYFESTLKLFTESQHFNTCLNRKISIDTEGNIKNCPSMKKSFGNIIKDNIEDIVELKEFKKYWTISKDMIKVCKDCEFRHVCTDCRAYIENPSDLYSKPLKCGYNPYSAEWEDWATNPLKQKAIEFYKMK